MLTAEIVQDKIPYEFMFNGRCAGTGVKQRNQTRVIPAWNIGDAERELKRDYLTIDIFFKGVAL